MMCNNNDEDMCISKIKEDMSFWRYESDNIRGPKKLLEEEKNDNSRDEVFT